ncbi:MAG: phytoene desaturase family protein [Bacteroidia bacterium]|nr:phytoene desaturase family protein [Bacteroidia bacterium]
MKSKTIVIGSGISGLAASAYLGQYSDVLVVEKNKSIGGRARQMEDSGFKFDMGPSWYWMPDIFEKFFLDFGYSSHQFYELIRLNPSFQIIFEDDVLVVPDNKKDIILLFEKYEKGSGDKLVDYLNDTKHLYDVAVNKMLYKPYVSAKDYLSKDVLDWKLISSLFLNVSYSIRKRFKNPKLIQLLEFPVIFLGATASQIPSLYGLMNYAALELGTWYPLGGMYEIIKAIQSVAEKQGVEIQTATEVHQIVVKNNKAIGVETNKGFYMADVVLSSADYAFTETKLLDSSYANYNTEYWNKRTFAPSALIFYLGVNKKISRLLHHNLFFDSDFEKHIQTVYQSYEWPNNPLFYLCVPSKTDNSIAPPGTENLFILIPVAIGLEDNTNIHHQIFNNVLSRIEKFTGENIRDSIVIKHTYSVSNFIEDYNSFKGNAYGLANTLFQTATFKPKMINQKIKNLFYTGQLTVPGPGVPPSLISAKLSSQLIYNYLKQKNYERVV